MKNILHFFTIAICIGIIITGCDDDSAEPIETSTLSLAISANYDGNSLVVDEGEYDYGGNAIRFSKVNFYASDITLGKTNTTDVTELSDVKFINLTQDHTSNPTSPRGTVINFSKTPVDNYNSMSIGVGVSADLNRTQPSDYATSHPLGADNSGDYWAPWNSYIFAKIEGQYDADGNGFDSEDVAFAYHVGLDEMYRDMRFEFEAPLSLQANETSNIALALDIKKLLTKEDGTLLSLSTHDPSNQAEEMRVIMDNFAKALQLQ